jgi:hypothetical protein
MPDVLFINHAASRCGVYMFGLEIAQQLKTSRNLDCSYVECESPKEFTNAVAAHNPDVIILNQHPTTMPWAQLAAGAACDRPTIGIVHDATSEMADRWDGPRFDVLVTHDPDLRTSNPLFVSATRPIPTYSPKSAPPDTGPIFVGSFGFAASDKGFEDVVALAQDAFGECTIRIHMPRADYADLDDAIAIDVMKRCNRAVRRPGIKVEFERGYLSRDELIEFLASNHLNAFLYAQNRGMGGISSTTDWAMAAGRPIALRRGKMFRHLSHADPSIFVDELSLAQILKNGTIPLKPFVQAWSSEALVSAYEGAVSRALSLRAHEACWRNYVVRRAAATVDAEFRSARLRESALEEIKTRLSVLQKSKSFRVRRILRDWANDIEEKPIVGTFVRWAKRLLNWGRRWRSD